MARYVDSKCKLCRREGVKLLLKGSRCETVKCSIVKRKSSSPGPKSKRVKKLSEYGIHFREKQKLKRFYGIFERQFRNYFAKSERKEGNTGQNLLVLLERRLDNVLFHFGYGLSRSHSRQVINHGHITVNGRKVDIASYLVKAGDVIKPKNKENCIEMVKLNVDSNKNKALPSWLEIEDSGLEGRILHLPTRDDISIKDIQEQLVVELCSK